MFHFVANLKPYTLLEVPSDQRFDAYLLSADYVRGLAELASMVKAEQRVLIADNGNMDVFRSMGREFAAEAAELDDDRRASEKARGRYARPGDLPVELRARFRELAEKMAVRSEAITTDEFARDAVRRQVAIDPSMLVGMEDLALGTMGGLNIESEYVELPESFFAERAQRAVTFARRTIDGELGEVRGKVLAGLHALDYDTAVVAGRVAAEAGLDGVTLGMFGALTDRNYVDFRVEDGKVIELSQTVPRPYLRVVEIAAGVLEGYRRAGRARPAFHALGVGTPILLPLLSLLGAGEPYFATDSTAPIVDGWSSPTISLYVTDPAPLKYKAHAIAEVWIRGGRGWDCECPYCSRFREAHPPELGRAQKWWREQGKPAIKKEMLERNGPLSSLLPFLGYPANDALRTEASLARVGHNHWMLRRLELEIRQRSASWPDLLAWVGGIVEAYRGAPGSESWKAAVTEAFALARAVGERLHGSVQVHEQDIYVANIQEPGYHRPMMGYGNPLIRHQSSRALFHSTLELLRKTEDIARAWQKLQPVAVGLAGHAAQILDALRSNTIAVEARLEQRADYADAWRTVLTEAANSESEEAQLWREALLSAAKEVVGDAKAQARVDALLEGKAPILRIADLGRQAATDAQSPFVTTYAAATATSFRLSYLGTYLATVTQDDGDELAPLDEATTEWLASFTQGVVEFITGSFSQFHGLVAADNTAVADVRALAQSVLDDAAARGLSIGQVLGDLSRQGVPAELAAKLGPVVLSLAEAGSRLGLLVAYAAHGIAHAHSLGAKAWLAGERKTAQLDFASKVPTGLVARIDELSGLEEDVLVEVQGVVESLSLDHDPKPPKFSSFVVLRAFGAPTSVRLRAHMFSLEKNGLVVGAYCKVRGFVRRQQPWLKENETGLDIDRVSLSQLRKSSWLDAVAYHMRPFYRLYQDEMSLFSTPGGV